MVLTKTPICNFGEKPYDFDLKGVDGKNYKLNDCLGEKGTIIMFICNHCPYVKAIIKELVKDIGELKKIGIQAVAIMSNDTKKYQDDSFENMLLFSKLNKFNFPYLFDETQNTAKKFGAVCTPDFFGYNKDLKLQYRGRFRELRELTPVTTGESELKLAMKLISKSQNGPKKQIPSMGCNIKWIK
tara:strand:- start:495 stop:1049 length:555 start_codon:yes stop_codon:yes gene_type:complete